MLKIVLRPRAETDLQTIAQYTKVQHGEAQAKHYIEDIRRQIEFAARFPGIGSEAFGLPSTYRKVRSGLHRVLYRCTESELVVVRVLHEREDVPDEIEDL
ncbi:MAG: type II toxin-antitoxin system RelE/ParE family toxin [Sphingopyxis sp.]